jgi:hypothetical protein
MPAKLPFEPKQLNVIAVVSNPMRFRSRIDLYRKFEKMCLDAGVTLWTCELAYGDRPFEITRPDNPRHLQMRTFFELWHKENMANLLVQRLPQDWEYVAFIDADVQFIRPDWAVETIHMLQHHYVVQMWHEAYDLGPDYQVIHKHQSLMWRYVNGLPIGPGGNYYGAAFGHPGYAWAWRREAYDHVGCLIDKAILGAGDHHMALSLIGRGEQSMPGNINQAYYDEILRWQDRALRYLTKDVGYVSTAINHFWHGKKKDRKYVERWQVLIKNDFTPHLDLKRDWQGLWQLTDRSPQLRDDIRSYFRSRSEDSIDL